MTIAGNNGRLRDKYTDHNGNGKSTKEPKIITSDTLYPILELIYFLYVGYRKSKQDIIDSLRSDLDERNPDADDRQISRILARTRNLGFIINVNDPKKVSPKKDGCCNGDVISIRKGSRVMGKIFPYDYQLDNEEGSYRAIHYLLDYMEFKRTGKIEITEAREIIEECLTGEHDPRNIYDEEGIHLKGKSDESEFTNEETLRAQLARFLKKRLRETKKTVIQLAKEIGISPSALGLYLCSKAFPSPERLQKIFEIFRVPEKTIDDLLVDYDKL